MIIDKNSSVSIDTCNIHDTWSSGVWTRGSSTSSLSSSLVTRCGGYGSLYCTNGATLKIERVKQSLNPRGCGVFVLHDKSRVVMINSSVDTNKWSGFGCREEILKIRINRQRQGQRAEKLILPITNSMKSQSINFGRFCMCHVVFHEEGTTV